jgi:hypothetical protein
MHVWFYDQLYAGKRIFNRGGTQRRSKDLANLNFKSISSLCLGALVVIWLSGAGGRQIEPRRHEDTKDEDRRRLFRTTAEEWWII